jgi:hypothetical protein
VNNWVGSIENKKIVMKNKFIILTLIYLFSTSCNQESNKAEVNDRVLINYIQFDISTITSVSCWQVSGMPESKSIDIKSEQDVASFNKTLNDFKEIQYKDIDVRGKIIFSHQGDTTEFCFDKWGNFSGDKKTISNSPLFELILKGINGDFLKIYTADSCLNNFQAINFSTFIDSASKYHGQLVEITGYYRWIPEASLISFRLENKKLGNMVWVNFNSQLSRKTESDTVFLFDPRSEFEAIKEKKITVRGRVDASSKGNEFLARLENTCYLKVED